MRIRIIATPSGEAPEWVRKAWVRLELPTDIRPFPFRRIGILSGTPKEDVSGHRVRMNEALRILGENNAMAAKWFRENLSQVSIALDHFVFDCSVCEIVNDN